MRLITAKEHQHIENRITQLYESILKPGDTFLDIGANIGHHTWRMGSCVGPSGSGHAIEPGPQFHEKLSRVLQIKKIDWVNIYKVAVSDKVGEAVFYYRPNHPGWSSLYEGFRHPNDRDDVPEKNTTPVTTIDNLLLDNLTQLKFIKLDTENSEFPILKGSVSVLKEHKPVIVFESMFEAAMTLNNYTLEEFYDFFETVDYTLFDLDGQKIKRQNFVPSKIDSLTFHMIAAHKDTTIF